MSELELAVTSPIECLHVGPLSAGALQSILRPRLGRVFARPTLLRLHEASGGNPFFALELARALGDNVDPTQPLPVPETLDALVRAHLDALPAETRRALLLACTHGRLTPADLEADILEPAFADDVIELADGAIRFTHPLFASALYQAATPEARRLAHERLAEIVDDPLARARHRALASHGPDADVAAALEEAASVAIARGASSSLRISASTPCVRHPPTPLRTATGAHSRPHTHTSLLEKERGLVQSRSSFLRPRQRGRRASRHSCSCPS